MRPITSFHCTKGSDPWLHSTAERGLTPLSRRRALAGAAALLLTRAAPAAAQEPDSAGALLELLAREQAAALAYRTVGMERLAAQEGEHVRALAPQLESLGLPVPFPARPGLDGAARRLAAAAGPSARARAAISLETELVRAYRAALDRLDDPSIIRTAATIMAGHGQHLVVLQADPLDALE